MSGRLRILLVLGGRACAAGGSVFLSIVLSRYYGVGVLGAFTIMSTGAALAVIVAGGGYGTAFLREASRLNATEKSRRIGTLYRTIALRLAVRLPLPLVACIGAGLLYSSTIDSLGVGAVVLLSLPILFLPWLALSCEYFKAVKRAEVSVLLNPGLAALTTGGCVLVAGVVLAPPDVPPPVGVYTAYALSCAAVCLLGWWLVMARTRDSVPRSSPDVVPSMLVVTSSRSDYLRAQLYTFLSFSGLFLFAGLSLDEEEIGIVRLAERIAAPMALALSVISPLIASDLAGSYARGDVGNVKRIVRRTSKLCTAFAVVFTLAVVVFIGEIAAASGVQTSDVLVPVLVIMFGGAINLACGPLGTVLNMTRHEGEVKRISLVTLCASLLFTQLALFVAGTLGFAVALAFSYCLKNALMLHVYRRSFAGEVRA